MDSNTTFVKVKYKNNWTIPKKRKHSNTTFVKVKCSNGQPTTISSAKFKYNIC